MDCFTSPTLNPSIPSLLKNSAPSPPLLSIESHPAPRISRNSIINTRRTISVDDQTHKIFLSSKGVEFETEEYEEQKEGPAFKAVENAPPGIRQKQRRRYRKQFPGEAKGITEEMRFVTMKLRNGGGRNSKDNSAGAGAAIDVKESDTEGKEEEDVENNYGENGGLWEPSMEGFLKFLVDSKLVFETVEHIVDESSDVSYVYFRKTGLERSDCLSKDIESLREQGKVIPEPSDPGTAYAQYLKELAEKSHPLFLCHFYNIYFSHIAGGQVIAKQVSDKLLDGRELEFCKWEGDAEELLKGVREKLNALGEHWSRDEKSKCLRETTKTFRFLGQIVRLITL